MTSKVTRQKGPCVEVNRAVLNWVRSALWEDVFGFSIVFSSSCRKIWIFDFLIILQNLWYHSHPCFTNNTTLSLWH